MDDVKKAKRGEGLGLKAIEVRKLCSGYGSRRILSDISFSIKRGERVALIGPNGAGKSTLLKTIAGMIPDHSGEISVSGRDVRSLTDNERAKLISLMLSKVPSGEWMTVREIVENGRYPYTGRFGILSDKDRDAVEYSLKTADVKDIAEKFFKTLSDGQKQRVMFARAVCQEPELMLLDEPTSFLDIKYKTEFMGLIEGLAKTRGTAMLMSLHELYLAEYADRILCIKDGRLFTEGSPEDILKKDIIMKLYDLNKGEQTDRFLKGVLRGRGAAGEI